jgi:hypothetical protein
VVSRIKGDSEEVVQTSGELFYLRGFAVGSTPRRMKMVPAQESTRKRWPEKVA